jgi:hypothetical protein
VLAPVQLWLAAAAVLAPVQLWLAAAAVLAPVQLWLAAISSAESAADLMARLIADAVADAEVRMEAKMQAKVAVEHRHKEGEAKLATVEDRLNRTQSYSQSDPEWSHPNAGGARRRAK